MPRSTNHPSLHCRPRAFRATKSNSGQQNDGTKEGGLSSTIMTSRPLRLVHDRPSNSERGFVFHNPSQAGGSGLRQASTSFSLDHTGSIDPSAKALAGLSSTVVSITGVRLVMQCNKSSDAPGAHVSMTYHQLCCGVTIRKCTIKSATVRQP